MTAFETQMQSDFENAFADPEAFGELVTLTSPAGVVTQNVPAVYAEYIGAIDEKTQAPFILPADSGADRDWRITRPTGSKWQIVDVSQRDAACLNCRAVQPQLSA